VEAACPAFLRRRRTSTAAPQICQQKRTRRVWPSWRRGRMTSPLKTIVSWYEGADSRCRHEIFGDVFLLAFLICADGVNGDFLAHDAEQAFVSRIKHTGPRIACCRDVADHRGKFCSHISGKPLRRHDARTRCAFG